MPSSSSNSLKIGILLAAIVAAGWGIYRMANQPADGGYGSFSEASIGFREDAPANSQPTAPLESLQFVGLDGKPFAISAAAGSKPLLLVVTRGSANGTICVYCSTQTSRLVHRKEEFARRGVEVAIVFPVRESGDQKYGDEFLKRVAQASKNQKFPAQDFPFRLLFDVGPAAVKKLAIDADLARPATYILDAAGNLRYAYVGENIADRPSVDAILKQLDAILKSAG